jgi:hypothetical protein
MLSYPLRAMRVSDFLRLDTMISSEDAESAGLVVEWTEDMGPLNFISHQWLSVTHPDPDHIQLRTMQQVLSTLSTKDPKTIMSADDWEKYSKTFVDGVDAAVRQQAQGAKARDEATVNEDENDVRHFAATIAEGYIWLECGRVLER